VVFEGDTMLKTKKGFTLLEVMVVVVIIAVTISAALFMGGGTARRTNVKNAARDIATLAKLAHNKASSERIYFNLVLNLDSEHCYLERHFSGDDEFWENLLPLSGDQRDDNFFDPDPSPGANKSLVRPSGSKVVDINNVNGIVDGEVRIAFSLHDKIMGYTTKLESPWDFQTADYYSIYVNDVATEEIQYMVVIDSVTSRVKLYSSW
jgi:prepilin-type N-terminal cleavage/methylation domain-containing protein